LERIYRDAQHKLFYVFRFVYLSTCYWCNSLGHCLCSNTFQQQIIS